MKSIMKKLLLIITLIIIGGASYVGYFYYFTNSKNINSFKIIPNDAIFIVKTDNLNKAWNSINESKLWNYLLSNPKFSKLNETMEKFEILIKDNPAIDLILSDRELVVSTHIISKNKFDMLYVIDIKNAANIPHFTKSLQLTGMAVNESIYRGTKFLQLTDRKKGTVIYLAVIDNLLTMSLNKNLIIDSILNKDNTENWETNKKFIETKEMVSQNELFNFYINYSELNRFINLFKNKKDNSELIGKLLSYSALSLSFDDDLLNLDGYTNSADLPSYLRALLQMDSAKTSFEDIVSNQMSLVFSLSFDNFIKFQKTIEDELQTHKKNEFKKYKQNIKMIEDLIDTDLQENFFNWIGNEITLFKMSPKSGNMQVKDIVIAIHANNISKAKKSMTFLTEQIKKKTPLRFDIKKHNNYSINFLNLNGFLKIFLGGVFDKIEKPFFTFIDNYAVFSNSEETLKRVIDDYVTGNTLSRKKKFMNFKNQFEKESNISFFVQTPKIYSNIYRQSKPETRKELNENRKLLMSFARVGFQFISDGNLFRTNFMAEHDSDAVAEHELEKMEIAGADEIFTDEYENGTYMINLTIDELSTDGKCVKYYSENKIKSEGNINSGKLSGLWRDYYKNGNLKSVVTYKNNKANGDATFYYNTNGQKKKSEVTFIDGMVTDKYREFYINGARKAIIIYENGKKNGDAKFFYRSGELKIKGEYDAGKKDDTWEYYSDKGENYKNEEWDEGKKE